MCRCSRSGAIKNRKVKSCWDSILLLQNDYQQKSFFFNNKYPRGCERSRILTASRSWNWCSHERNQCEGFPVSLKQNFQMTQIHHSWASTQKTPYTPTEVPAHPSNNCSIHSSTEMASCKMPINKWIMKVWYTSQWNVFITLFIYCVAGAGYLP